MISFAVEKQKPVWEEAEKGLFQMHWEALAIDKIIPWESNSGVYGNMEAKGMLHVVTARDERKLIGYHVGILGPHLHYKSAGTMCYEDMYYLMPEYRKGGTGAKLFMFVENSLREMGITKWYLSCKVHEDHSELFKALGFKNTDISFSKILVGEK